MRKLSAVIIAGFIALLLTAAAFATPITGVEAFTDMGNFIPAAIPLNTVDGSGLADLSFAGIHSATSPTNSWASNPGVTTGLFTFDLNGLYRVNGFAFWNQNNGGPGASGITGINRVNLLSSQDGTTFIPLAGGPTAFGRETGDSSSAQVFNFTPIWATHIRFSILSNHGDIGPPGGPGGVTGFAEVLFDGSPVPEPTTLLLLGTGLVGVAAARRKKQK